MAPYLALRPGADRAARVSRWWGPIVPVFESSEGFSVLDPAERAKSLAYGVFTAGALRALRETVQRANDALPRVTAPTLVVQSREDNRIAVQDAERASRGWVPGRKPSNGSPARPISSPWTTDGSGCFGSASTG